MERASIKRHGRNLPLAGLGLPSRLGKLRVVWRMERPLLDGHVPRAEAGAAEGGLDNRAGLHQACESHQPLLVSASCTGMELWG